MDDKWKQLKKWIDESENIHVLVGAAVAAVNKSRFRSGCNFIKK